MIEIKLALCIEFPRKMGPGVFISCPDIMELFTIEQGDWTFERPGITAIAHPSPIEIGTTHGVFILDEKPHVDCSKQSDLPLVRSLRIGAGGWGRGALQSPILYFHVTSLLFYLCRWLSKANENVNYYFKIFICT